MKKSSLNTLMPILITTFQAISLQVSCPTVLVSIGRIKLSCKLTHKIIRRVVRYRNYALAHFCRRHNLRSSHVHSSYNSIAEAFRARLRLHTGSLDLGCIFRCILTGILSMRPHVGSNLCKSHSDSLLASTIPAGMIFRGRFFFFGLCQVENSCHQHLTLKNRAKFSTADVAPYFPAAIVVSMGPWSVCCRNMIQRSQEINKIRLAFIP